MMFDRIRSLLNMGYERDVFADYREETDAANLNSLKNITTAGVVISSIMLLVSLLPDKSLSGFTVGYAILTFALGITTLLSRTLLASHPKHVRGAWHFLLVLTYIGSALISSVLQPAANAVTMIVFLVLMPLFVIERPLVIYGITGLMSLVFIYLTWAVKEPFFSRGDIINTVVFNFCSVITYYQTVRAKMRDIVNGSQLRRQRDTDGLTGLRNRMSAEQEISRIITSGTEQALFIILDVDNFKDVNDRFGHNVGDQALVSIADTLRGNFRGCDTIARLGGDEFIVFLPACAYTEMMHKKINTLLDGIGAIETGGSEKLRINASAGVARYPEDGASFQNLYKSADQALYLAKGNGKKNFVVYGEALT